MLNSRDCSLTPTGFSRVRLARGALLTGRVLQRLGSITTSVRGRVTLSLNLFVHADQQFSGDIVARGALLKRRVLQQLMLIAVSAACIYVMRCDTVAVTPASRSCLWRLSRQGLLEPAAAGAGSVPT